MSRINSRLFYSEYHGHRIEHLQLLIESLKKHNPKKNFIYLAGDSSLDNKFWIRDDYMEAENGYESILDPPFMLPDICYHLNSKCRKYYTVNTAIEESTLADRANGLMPQDKIIQKYITNDDILIVSIGGNDIALKPSISTIYNILMMTYINSTDMIKQGPGTAWGMSYFIKMFKDDVEKYILKLIGDKRPKKIIVCMIYYPDQKETGSWADKTLGSLNYNRNPEKLQAAIKQIFIHATNKITIPDCDVVPFPMFEVLNGTDTNDYFERVEPSNQGGRKLAEAFIMMINK